MDARRNFRGTKLIIFGAGYVGSALAREAVECGLSVVALTRNTEKAHALSATGVRVVIADLASSSWHSQIAPQAHYVVNCVSSGGGGVEGYRRSYLEGMRSILTWARHSAWAGEGKEQDASTDSTGIGTFVYTSSTSVYPQSKGARVDETAPTEGAGETAQVLVETENLVRESRRLESSPFGRWFVLRLAGIYGPRRHHLIDQLKAKADEISGRGDHRLNLVHRDDIVAALWAVLGAPETVADQVFNVADDGAVSKAEVVAWLAQRLGVAVPRFTGEPAGGRRAITPDRVIANDKIKTMAGWKPRYPDFRSGYESVLLEA